MMNEQHMFQYVWEYANRVGAENTLAALPYAKAKHEGQFRKGSGSIPYITHPLQMACHALAMGVCQDALLATLLLHDVCEDCLDEAGNPIKPSALPVSKEVQEAVALLTKPMEAKEGFEKDYFQGIRTNQLAMMAKLIDRCNNISTMATCFSKEKMFHYISETEVYILPLLEVLKKEKIENYDHALVLLEYHMTSVLDTIKSLLKA